jgi:choice-of-anchor C domain-containing protein
MSQTTKPIFAVVVALSVLISGVAFIGSVSAQQPNLVQNGSFENSSNDFSSDKNYNTLVAGSTAITGWRVSSGEVDQVGNYWSPQEGSVSIDLSGGEPGAIEQNITGLEVGERYELTYYYRGQPKVDGPYDARVEVGDLDKTVTAVNPGDWTLATHNFTAGNTTETLTFTQGATPKSYAGMALDNVSIVESSDPIDTTAPNVSIDQPAGGATLTTSNVSLNVSANESGNWTYSVDGGPNQTATGTNGTQTLNVTLSGLADGSHTATVYIEDGGGNVDTDTVSFTVLTAPTLTTSSSGTDYTASTGGFVVDENLTVTDPDGEAINGATVAIGSGFDANVDRLAVNSTAVSDAGLTSSYDTSTGVLTLTGSASAAQMQTVLRTVTYTYSGETTASARDLDVSFALGTDTGGNVEYLPETGHFYEYVQRHDGSVESLGEQFGHGDGRGLPSGASYCYVQFHRWVYQQRDGADGAD